MASEIDDGGPARTDRVYLLTKGSGEDGDDWQVLGIYSTRDKAIRAKSDYDTAKNYRTDGTYWTDRTNDIEEWTLDPAPSGEGGAK